MLAERTLAMIILEARRCNVRLNYAADKHEH